jgi:ankyrin repeat protein
MGASWSIMALATALGPARKLDLPPLREAEGSGVEPWAETVLFGSVSELRALFDKKFDPNSATKGGTTALMMAMPDIEKAKLLLERGANVNARSKSRYSALLVAAQSPGSLPVMRLLLDRGAEVRVPKGSGAPLFNATALGLAIQSGNTAAVPLFLAKGDKLDEKFVFIGLFPGSTVFTSISFDDNATLAALLDAGMPVDYSDDNGFTLLDTAVVANRADAARLLISRGAKIDLADKQGMTPLLYAASIDFGDSTMLDLLVKSGADRKTRTPEGLTALELARKYDHRHLIASLEH